MKLNFRPWMGLVLFAIVVLVLLQIFSKKTSSSQPDSSLQTTTNVHSKAATKTKSTDRAISSVAPNQPNANISQGIANVPSLSTSTGSDVIYGELIENLKMKTGLKGWRVDGTEGARKNISVSGEIFRLPLGSIGDRLQWARFLAEQVGVKPDQIVDADSKLEDSKFTKSYELVQSYKGFLVEGSFVRVHERKPDGFIYYSSMSLLDIGHPDLNIKVDRSEAQSLVRQNYGSVGRVDIIKVAQEPVIYPIVQGLSELAWRIDFKVTGSFSDVRQVLISAKSGAILRETPMVVY